MYVSFYNLFLIKVDRPHGFEFLICFFVILSPTCFDVRLCCLGTIVGFFIFLVATFTSIYMRDSNDKTYLLKNLYYANFFGKIPLLHGHSRKFYFVIFLFYIHSCT